MCEAVHVPYDEFLPRRKLNLYILQKGDDVHRYTFNQFLASNYGHREIEALVRSKEKKKKLNKN